MLRVKPGLAIPLAEIAFAADTSGGKGGQHANRSSTRVELRFDVLGSPSLSARQRALIQEKLGPRIAADGTLRRESAASRCALRAARARARAEVYPLCLPGARPRAARTAHRDEADSRL